MLTKILNLQCWRNNSSVLKLCGIPLWTFVVLYWQPKWNIGVLTDSRLEESELMAGPVQDWCAPISIEQDWSDTNLHSWPVTGLCASVGARIKNQLLSILDRNDQSTITFAVVIITRLVTTATSWVKSPGSTKIQELWPKFERLLFEHQALLLVVQTHKFLFLEHTICPLQPVLPLLQWSPSNIILNLGHSTDTIQMMLRSLISGLRLFKTAAMILVAAISTLAHQKIEIACPLLLGDN